MTVDVSTGVPVRVAVLLGVVGTGVSVAVPVALGVGVARRGRGTVRRSERHADAREELVRARDAARDLVGRFAAQATLEAREPGIDARERRHADVRARIGERGEVAAVAAAEIRERHGGLAAEPADRRRREGRPREPGVADVARIREARRFGIAAEADAVEDGRGAEREGFRARFQRAAAVAERRREAAIERPADATRLGDVGAGAAVIVEARDRARYDVEHAEELAGPRNEQPGDARVRAGIAPRDTRADVARGLERRAVTFGADVGGGAERRARSPASAPRRRRRTRPRRPRPCASRSRARRR